MAKHRSPQGRVSNDVHPDNTDDTGNKDTPDTPDTFDPGEALQNLHMGVVELEALTNAANEAVVQLPFPKGREERRPFDRVYALVTKVADETSALATHGAELMDALAAHLKRKQADA